MTDQQASAQTNTPPAACLMVIFGGGGDLTRRKLLPALHNLARQRLLDADFTVLGVDRIELDDAAYRAQLNQGVQDSLGKEFSSGGWDDLLKRVHYQHGDFQDPATYSRLADRLGQLDAEHHTGGRYLFYLATPPRFFGEIATQLGHARLSGKVENCWRANRTCATDG